MKPGKLYRVKAIMRSFWSVKSGSYPLSGKAYRVHYGAILLFLDLIPCHRTSHEEVKISVLSFLDPQGKVCTTYNHKLHEFEEIT